MLIQFLNDSFTDTVLVLNFTFSRDSVVNDLY
jgi:hypothetical protein